MTAYVLRRLVREQQEREPDPTTVVLDSQSVKTTEAGGERGFDAGKQLKGRKRQVVVDTQGNLLTVAVQPANVQDRDVVSHCGQMDMLTTHKPTDQCG